MSQIDYIPGSRNASAAQGAGLGLIASQLLARLAAFFAPDRPMPTVSPEEARWQIREQGYLADINMAADF